MNILLNASTINVGGGLFVTVNFIKESLVAEKKDVEWYYLISKAVHSELMKASIQLPREQFSVIERSPARIFGKKKTARKISHYENKINPDLIFSIGSPSYINFHAIEVQRLTNPYITHPNKYAIKSYRLIDRIKIRIKSFIQKKIISKNKFFITQTAAAKKGIIKLTDGKGADVAVIPNSLSKVFRTGGEKSEPSDDNYIFCLAAPYPHKNIHEIPKVARKLLDKNFENFKFVVTIPETDPFISIFRKECNEYGVSNRILNVGKITQAECKVWYLKSKVVFLPTYLETFSATILESLYLKVPIVTTNFEFNKDISGSYALYFEPGDWNTAVDHILQLLSSDNQKEKVLIPDIEFEKKFKMSHENYKETVCFLKKVWQNEV